MRPPAVQLRLPLQRARQQQPLRELGRQVRLKIIFVPVSNIPMPRHWWWRWWWGAWRVAIHTPNNCVRPALPPNKCWCVFVSALAGAAAADSSSMALMVVDGGAAGAGAGVGLVSRRRLARHYLALAASQLDGLMGEAHVCKWLTRCITVTDSC